MNVMFIANNIIGKRDITIANHLTISFLQSRIAEIKIAADTPYSNVGTINDEGKNVTFSMPRDLRYGDIWIRS